MESRDISAHDELLVKKITNLCFDSKTRFESAVCSSNLFEMITLYYEGLISHMEDLVDELESPELKAGVLLYLIEFKACFAKTRSEAKARLDFLEGRA